MPTQSGDLGIVVGVDGSPDSLSLVLSAVSAPAHG